MWNENVPTARILLETEEKAMERWCNLLQSAIQSEKETKRNEKIHAARFEAVKQ